MKVIKSLLLKSISIYFLLLLLVSFSNGIISKQSRFSNMDSVTLPSFQFTGNIMFCGMIIIMMVKKTIFLLLVR